jgi:hypothetical protein
MYRTIESCRAVIQKYLGRYGTLAPHEAEELERAYQEIKDIQKNCTHSFNEFTCFSSKIMQCKYCMLKMDDYG